MKEEVLYTPILKNRRHTTPHGATQKGTRAGQEAKGTGGNVGKNLHGGFHGKARQAWSAGIGLTSLKAAGSGE